MAWKYENVTWSHKKNGETIFINKLRDNQGYMAYADVPGRKLYLVDKLIDTDKQLEDYVKKLGDRGYVIV